MKIVFNKTKRFFINKKKVFLLEQKGFSVIYNFLLNNTKMLFPVIIFQNSLFNYFKCFFEK